MSFKKIAVLLIIVLVLSACSNSAPPAPKATEAPKAAATEVPAEKPAEKKNIIIGLVTKTETNPFFVKMKEGAQKKADELGAKLLTGAGSFDGDNEGQVTAIENMINAGAQGILITPSDTKAIVPAIDKARKAGVMVIALDTPTDPITAIDALFATDNFKAGLLIGQYAKAAMGGKPVKIATLDLLPGITVGVLRHNGFMVGYGLSTVDATAPDQVTSPEVVCSQDTQGDQAKGQTAMENCLQKNPDINLVYTINEPAAFGAYTALKAAGKEKDVLIVSVDGGCAGVEGIVSGQIGATSQQYPLKMASTGVEAVIKFVQTGEKASGYVDTGVTLITNKPAAGVDSKDAVFGIESCWGTPSAGALDAAKAAAGKQSETKPVEGGKEVIIGLVTKTETNPFFVKMKEGAQKKADELGAKLLTGAGSFDGDNEGQVTAIENMINAGAQGILITPSDTKAIVPAIDKARKAGVMVIALDTPTDPITAIDALFATDNFKAGLLIGQYAKAAMGGKPVKIATLDLLPGITVGVLRHNGFMVGYGLSTVDATAPDQVTSPEVVCSQDTQGDQAKGQTAMENCLQKNPDINLVYTINEPAAFGAYTALKAAGKEKDVLIVSVDGGCAGVEGIVSGQIGATSQQYPLKMATMGVEAVVKFVQTGEKASGYVDTGVTLITDKPAAGVDSKDTVFGVENCWGNK